MRWYILYLFTFFLACQQPTAQTTQDAQDETPTYDGIIELQRQLLAEGADTLNMELAGRIVNMSEQFAEANPDDTLTAEILFKGGDIARGMRSFGKAIEMWGVVWRSFPESTQGPYALFFQGFTFDNDLQDKDLAKKYYEQFLTNYPEHELADQARLLLASLDQSPEELLREIQRQNEEKLNEN